MEEGKPEDLGKTRGPWETLLKQVWTGNQMHIRCWDWESDPGLVVHSTGEDLLRYLLIRFAKEKSLIMLFRLNSVGSKYIQSNSFQNKRSTTSSGLEVKMFWQKNRS